MGSPAALAVTRLDLTDFRSYAHLRLTLEPAPVVLVGPNGAGKTNRLEALSFLAPGRGLRRARLADITRREAGPAARWAVAARLRSAAETLEIGTGLDPEGGETRKVRIDGQPARGQVELSRRAGAVWLTPAMDRLMSEGPAGRRRFLDRIVFGFDADHAGRVAAYERALRERAHLIEEKGKAADPAWLDALEATLAAKGVAIAATRKEAVERLARVIEAARDGFPKARLQAAGALEDGLERRPAIEVEARYCADLAGARGEGPTPGPHRSDLVIHHGSTGAPAVQCSTGEQKALLVTLVLAQARLMAEARGFMPLVLLDEVAAHLDAKRRADLFAALVGLGAQFWATGTDRTLFAGMENRVQFLGVDRGAVTTSEGADQG
ncbi:MAG: DNA replication/repair protein RecF [Rhodospirillales bacterium]|nr:DNA replication/repair protein RecF [Rhodospirillales bacterium]